MEITYDYESLGKCIGVLVSEKQKAYGDSFGKSGPIMKILYPEGISLDKLNDALVVVRIIDKLSRIATDKDALGESPFMDIAGYGILGARAAARGETHESNEQQSKNTPIRTYHQTAQ